MTRSRTDRPIWSRAVAVCVVALCLIGATSSAAAAVPGLMLARDLGATERLVRALLALGQLVAHHALQNVRTWLQAEDLFCQADRAGVAAAEGLDLDVNHYSAPSAAVASVPLLAADERSAAGFGALSGSAALTASRM